MLNPPPFHYVRPKSLEEALTALESAANSRPLAGGTDLVPMRAHGVIGLETLIDVKGIPGLEGIRPVEGHVTIGSRTCMADLANGRTHEIDAIADGAQLVGGPQTRNRAR